MRQCSLIIGPLPLATVLFSWSFLLGCSETSVLEQVSQLPSDPGDGELNREIYQGPVPEELDIRLERRDVVPLTQDALIKFQAINRGKDPSVNYRWVLYEDGQLFLARHSGDTSNWQTPFDTDLPTTPTKRLSAEMVTSVIEELQKARFSEQPPYQADPTVEDGGFDIVTARVGTEVYEVIYEAVDTPLLEFLGMLVTDDD